MRRAALLIFLVALVGGCGGGGGDDGENAKPAETATTTPAPPAFERATAVIATKRGERVEVDVEVAETQPQREFGLMYRPSLPARAGMVFLFERDMTGGFWMKNTLIPLSIAFFDRKGRILRIMDMEPCRADPCPVYDPGLSYRGALEVNRGAFRRWGVSRGDVVAVRR